MLAKKNVGQKKCWPTFFWGQQKFGPKKICVKKNIDRKKRGSNKIWVNKNLGKKKMVKKNLGKGRLRNSKPGKSWETIPTSPDPSPPPPRLGIFLSWEWFLTLLVTGGGGIHPPSAARLILLNFVL